MFGFWAGVFALVSSLFISGSDVLHYIENVNYAEPLFVFVIMAVAATKPVLGTAEHIIEAIAQKVPGNANYSRFFLYLSLGPLLGSLITEPAAMTVCAMLLRKFLFQQAISTRFRYMAIATLFVNVSVGGTLTHFAAPPVLMVAGPWSWNTSFMLSHFGLKAVAAILFNTVLISMWFRHELKALKEPRNSINNNAPLWLSFAHFAFIAITVIAAHHPVVFIGAFLFFLGLASITTEYQDELKVNAP